jgi:cytochrome bd-type quinol oxidase subunit 2
MNWILIVVIYLSIGIGIFVWRVRKDKKKNPESEVLPEKMFFLFDIFLLLMCLLWPFILFSEIKNRRAVNHIGNDDIE